jgi:hypothetical protein
MFQPLTVCKPCIMAIQAFRLDVRNELKIAGEKPPRERRLQYFLAEQQVTSNRRFGVVVGPPS